MPDDAREELPTVHIKAPRTFHVLLPECCKPCRETPGCFVGRDAIFSAHSIMRASAFLIL